MPYSNNVVYQIKKGETTYDIKDAVAAAAIDIINGGANQEGSIAKAKSDVVGTSSDTKTADTVNGAKAFATDAANTAKSDVVGTSSDLSSADTINGAKKYAKGLVDDILGEDSATSTLTSLKAVIAELNDPENAEGITGTFVDTVKADLAGLTKDDGNGGTTSATVKEYVDNAVNGATSGASAAIAALDATVGSTGGTNVAVQVVEADGVITGVNITTDNTVNSTDVSNAISSNNTATASSIVNGVLELKN